MIAPTPFFSDRGCHVRILGELQALKKLGHEVLLCTYHIGKDIDGVGIERIFNIPWYKKVNAGPSYHKYYLDLLLMWKVFSAALKFKPDIFHAHLHEGAFIGLWQHKLFRAPLVFDLQGSLTDEIVDHKFTSPNKLQFRLLRHLEHWINNKADAVITSSTKTAESVHKIFKVPESNIWPVIDGVDAAMFKPAIKKNEELLRQYTIPRNKIILLYLGLLDVYQGTDLLLEAVVALRNRRSDFHALIAGYPNEDFYRQKAQELDIADCVTFTGRIDYPLASKVIGLGDIAVSPKISLTEGNQKICNYMACALPVVAFDSPVNREILGDLGVYATLGDANSLADSLEYLIKNASLRRRLGRESRKRVQQQLSWEHSAQRIVQIYDQLTGRSVHNKQAC